MAPQTTSEAHTITVSLEFHPTNTTSASFHFSDRQLFLSGAQNPGKNFTVFWKLHDTPDTTLVEVRDWHPTTPALGPGIVTQSPPSGFLAKGITNNNNLHGAVDFTLGYKLVVQRGQNTFTSTDPEVVLEPPV